MHPNEPPSPDVPADIAAEIERLRELLLSDDQELRAAIDRTQLHARAHVSALVNLSPSELLARPDALVLLRSLLGQLSEATSKSQKAFSGKGGKARWQTDQLHTEAISYLMGLIQNGDWPRLTHPQLSGRIKQHLALPEHDSRYGTDWVAGKLHEWGYYKQLRK